MKEVDTTPQSSDIISPSKVDVIKTWIWTEEVLYILDQKKLPLVEKYLVCDTAQKVRKAIKELSVRGAPAIGICGAIGLVIGFRKWLKLQNPLRSIKTSRVLQEIGHLCNILETSRPTAVNLFWALRRMRKRAEKVIGEKTRLNFSDLENLYEALKDEALKIWEEDIEWNLSMAEHGAKALKKATKILTHCNTGALATGGYGTALGVIRKLYEKTKRIFVWVDETRPLLQGARLTAWELSKVKIPYKIITDNSAGFLMKKGEVDAIIVGADRIAQNGDTANKIGTYSLAVLAKHHSIPFYIAAPSSTFDLETPSGEEIPIEERDEDEVLKVFGKRISPSKASALNLAFDVTPSELITGFITEKGVITPPYKKNIKKVLSHENQRDT